MVRDAPAALLTMRVITGLSSPWRVFDIAPHSALVLRSPPEAGVSKDGHDLASTSASPRRSLPRPSR
ncbi:hypothetical protein BRAS3809_2430018 [Bradyrhizobium sp. STM 3809]|nr:hypothetical protein BRAS3809_2430018 [Bradyrhizobium sp. STM 3809]